MNKYWKNKFKNEYGIYVKTITLSDSYGFPKVYIVYTKGKNYRGCTVLDVCNKVFKSPQEIDKYFKNKR